MASSLVNACLIVVVSIGDHCMVSTSTITLTAVLAPYPQAMDSPAPLGSRYDRPDTFADSFRNRSYRSQSAIGTANSPVIFQGRTISFEPV